MTISPKHAFLNDMIPNGTEDTDDDANDDANDDVKRVFVLERNRLRIGSTSIEFMRTLRVGDGGTNALPPGFGNFVLRAVDPSDMRLPAHIRERGGVMLPIHQHEAMWIYFDADEYNPVALQIGAGGRCALTGRPITDSLSDTTQNYVVLPKQPWLDGFKTADGKVRQFVAVPLGSGHTVEKQLTGEETVGGLQIQVRQLTKEARQVLAEKIRESWKRHSPVVQNGTPLLANVLYCVSNTMGLGAGGEIRQEVFEDEHKIDDWNADPLDKVWIHLVAANDWPALTGEPVPASPISLDDYVEAGLPWFDYVDPSGVDVATTPEMAAVKSIHELGAIEGVEPTVGVESTAVVPLSPGSLHRGEWTWTEGRS